MSTKKILSLHVDVDLPDSVIGSPFHDVPLEANQVRRASSSSFGMVAFLKEMSPDVRTALGKLPRHYPVHKPNGTVTVIEEESFVILHYKIPKSNIEVHSRLDEFS